jgi:hypothetical protein
MFIVLMLWKRYTREYLFIIEFKCPEPNSAHFIISPRLLDLLQMYSIQPAD